MSTIDMNSVAGFKAVDAEGNELGIMSLADITAAVKESIMQDAAMARSVATQSEASTQAASDTYENKLPQLTDLTWARGLDSNENPILISKESLASVVGGLLRNNGYAKLKDYGIVNDTLNDKICGYGYSDGTAPEGDCGFAGIFSSECNMKAAKMIKISMDCNRIAVRASNFNGTWSSWRELSFK